MLSEGRFREGLSSARDRTPARGDATSGGRRSQRVALVQMPFSSTRFPSIQLGLLQAILAHRGLPATTLYPNLHFAARIGWEAYETLSTEFHHLLGEWVFARAAFGEEAPDAARFLDAFADELAQLCARLGWGIEDLVRLRDEEAPDFIRHCAENLPWEQYDVVGFSSVFEQNTAALALARKLKQRHPHLVTVFGGANYEDEMGLEYVRAFSWIDYAVIGEGEETFPALLRCLAAGEAILAMPGVAFRGPDGVVFGGRPPLIRDLDALPEPDYDDFFAAAAEIDLPRAVNGVEVQLPFESSRGCWWGAKHHCTFCGLNALGMDYRSKSPERALAGIDELARRYGLYSFMVVDNILNQRYIRELFGALAERRSDYAFFWAIKANLTPVQLRMMARGGIRTIQPGIESLDSHLLQLMRKGVSALQNVRLLKWAQYYGIHVAWNLLMGFPGERLEDYERQLRILRLIPHLAPPDGAVRIFLERFSPNFTDADQFGIRNVRADRAYASVYPQGIDPERIAYFFDYEAPGTLPDEAYASLQDYVTWWMQTWRAPIRPYLGYRRGAGRMTILDGRCPEAPVAHVLEEPSAVIYEACGLTAHGAPQVRDQLLGRGVDLDPGTVERELRMLVDRGLMLEEDGHYLSLALPANANW